MNGSLFKKKNYGAKKDNHQSSTDNMADSELTSSQVATGESETPEQHDSDPLDQDGPQEPLTSTDEPVHPVHKRSTAPRSPAAQVATSAQPGGINTSHEDQQAGSLTPSMPPTSQGQDMLPAEPQPTPVAIPDTSQQQEPTQHPSRQLNMEQVQPEIRTQPATSFSQQTGQQPAFQTSPTIQTDGMPVTQDGQLADPPLQAPLPTPFQGQAMKLRRKPLRTKTPRQDGKITLLAVIDKELHSRVKNAAIGQNVSLKRMVEMMIQHSFPKS